jgi:hypothetical protein
VCVYIYLEREREETRFGAVGKMGSSPEDRYTAA